MASLGTARWRLTWRVARPRRILPAASLLLAGLGLMAMSAPAPGSARDGFVAGGRATAQLPLDDAAASHILERAARVARALGLPDGVRDVTRLTDRFEGSVIDEVVTVDGAGRPSAIERFAGDGRLRLAVQLGWSEPAGAIPEGRAVEIAARLLGDAGIRAAGDRLVARDGQGWTVSWSRSAGGVPVRGDGTTVRLWADGSIHSIAVVESPLAPVPGTRIEATTARNVVEALVTARASAVAIESPSIGGTELAWVAPNDLLDPGLPDAPSPERRLAWVVRLTPTGALSERFRAYELYVDAGDGRLLGGDVLE
jgi:hypothetical protein